MPSAPGWFFQAVAEIYDRKCTAPDIEWLWWNTDDKTYVYKSLWADGREGRLTVAGKLVTLYGFDGDG